MTVSVHNLVDSRAVVLQFIAERTAPDWGAIGGVLHYVPNFDSSHRVSREQDEVRCAVSRVEIRS